MTKFQTYQTDSFCIVIYQDTVISKPIFLNAVQGDNLQKSNPNYEVQEQFSVMHKKGSRYMILLKKMIKK